MSRQQINTKADGKCGYIVRFNSKEVEVYANTMFEAKQLAVKHFKPSKSKEYMVNVMLAEINGKPVIHTPTN